MTSLSSWLLAAAAALLLLNTVMHASAYAQVRAAAAASNLATFFGQSLRALWLIEFATLLMLAVVFGLVAARLAMASGVVVALVALVPASTAGILYRLIGRGFVPAHFFLVAAVLALVAGLLRAAA